MSDKKKMYVDVKEICEDWGVSKSQAYKMIHNLNERMLAMNPNLIVIAGKANRKFYEESCYGIVKEASLDADNERLNTKIKLPQKSG